MRTWKTVLAAAALGVFCSIPVYANTAGPGVEGKWYQNQEDGRWRYEDWDGTKPVSQWKEIKDVWYYFDEQGYMKTGWIELDGKRYWADSQGAMAVNTKLVIDGREYVFGEDGVCENLYKAPTPIPPDSEKSELHRTVDAMADDILARIVNDNMTKTEKARAIYSWIRSNLKYVSNSEKGDWVKAAYEGLRRKRGDCYTYYAVSLALLNRVDIPSIEVIRLDGTHWWNLVNCGEGWYHFDTCPRSSGGRFCLLTDSQLMAYSNQHITRSYPYGSHGFDTSLYPATPE